MVISTSKDREFPQILDLIPKVVTFHTQASYLLYLISLETDSNGECISCILQTMCKDGPLIIRGGALRREIPFCLSIMHLSFSIFSFLNVAFLISCKMPNFNYLEKGLRNIFVVFAATPTTTVQAIEKEAILHLCLIPL